MEENIELYMQTEGYAVRQMPQYKVSPSIMELIRDAIHNSKMLFGIYHEKERLIEPLGLIYGTKIYLIAKEKSKGNEIYTYLLHKFKDLKLTDKIFDKGNFNLQEYTNQSFGVYHGKILDVKLSFTPDLAEEASKFNFHPTQKGKFEKDGSYTLFFKASGDKEIMWHVFKWGNKVKILAPKTLQSDYKKLLKSVLEKNDRI